MSNRVVKLSFASALCGFVLGCSAGLQNPPVAVTTPAPTPTPSAPSTGGTGLVFTQTNDAAANAILVLTAGADGALAQSASVPTGGKGSGGSLQNQGSVALNEAGSLLFAVNAGSNDFSVFRVKDGDLTFASRTDSGGMVPVSIAEANGIVYVLNDGSRAGGSDNISGFKVGADGTVVPIANSTRALSASSTSAAQVALSPDGSIALVTERGTAVLDTFAIDADGVPGPTLVNVSSGSIPFGFQFLDSSHVFVSEEGTNGVSSYSIAGDKTVPITRSAHNFQSATCWLAITPSGRFLYTTNTSAGTVSAFSIAVDGSVALIGTSGVAAESSGPPIDAIVSPDGKFLHVVDVGGSVDTFTIAADGSLRLLQSLGGLKSTINGIVAF